MALPITPHPLFKVKIPSLKKEVDARPMLVKEEKVLLMAKESNSYPQILLAIKQIVQNCLGEKIDVDKLKIFDLEYLFVQVRAASIDNISKVVYEDGEDAKEYPFDVDLEKVEVEVPEEPSLIIDFGADRGLKMKYPDVAIYNDKRFEALADETDEEILQDFVAHCIDFYFDQDKVTYIKDEKPADVQAFLDNLDVKTYGKIREFVTTIPTLKYDIKYTNSLGNEKTIKLRTLLDFFIV